MQALLKYSVNIRISFWFCISLIKQTVPPQNSIVVWQCSKSSVNILIISDIICYDGYSLAWAPLDEITVDLVPVTLWPLTTLIRCMVFHNMSMLFMLWYCLSLLEIIHQPICKQSPQERPCMILVSRTQPLFQKEMIRAQQFVCKVYNETHSMVIEMKWCNKCTVCINEHLIHLPCDNPNISVNFHREFANIYSKLLTVLF